MHFLDDDLELVDGISAVFRERCAELQELDRDATNLNTSMTAQKKKLFANYRRFTEEERNKKANEIRKGLRKVTELYRKKYQLSCELEALIGRVNNKVKKDVHDFRYELEMENPECTYEFEKKFAEDFSFKKSTRPTKKEVETPGRSRTNTRSNILSDLWPVSRTNNRSRSGSIVGTLQRRLTVNTQTQLFLGRKREASSRASSEHSPTPSTSRSTPRPSPAPISPAIRKFPRQSFSILDTPESSASPQPDFDPNSTSMPAFAGGQESRHGRPRKLTTKVKQMLEQKMRGVQYHQQVSSPLITQGCTAATINNPPRPASRNSRRNSVASTSNRIKGTVECETDNSMDGMDEDYETEEEEGEEAPPEEEEEPEDTDESLWCLCQTKAFGDMIACDNPQCRLEWFHYECIGMVDPPTGKWYCPECTQLGFQPSPVKRLQ
ncbi:unnamed protein product [Bursaphelenchus xylophilus]|uniref:Inhibitor of growth protein n=1 Tax=Bursaphelenchus xylophilus TaxID=6326 RepID=A0A1I7SS93_BURXY|nr:unnamed protein product [Bursaphelenchus xylophilus]CAG9097880.1 unnamed protein product [Bursaphelenchus xylophilus]